MPQRRQVKRQVIPHLSPLRLSGSPRSSRAPGFTSSSTAEKGSGWDAPASGRAWRRLREAPARLRMAHHRSRTGPVSVTELGREMLWKWSEWALESGFGTGKQEKEKQVYKMCKDTSCSVPAYTLSTRGLSLNWIWDYKIKVLNHQEWVLLLICILFWYTTFFFTSKIVHMNFQRWI